MKKRIIYIIVLIVFLIPKITYANEIKIDCPDKVTINKEFSCKLIGNSEMMVSGISAEVNVSKSLDLVSVITSDKWQGDGKDGDIKIFIDPEITGTFEIGTIKLKSNGTGNNIYIGSIFFYDDKVKSHKVESVSIDIPISDKNDDNSQNELTADSNYLVDLQVNNYNIDFYKQNNEYTVTIGDEKSLDITPILEDDSATYKITGNNNLKNGDKIKINVTSKDGKQQTYILNVKKITPSKKIAFGFIVIISFLIVINIIRLLMKKTSRGTKNE